MRDVNKEICRKWHVKPNNLGASLRSQWCYCLQQDWCSFWISLTRTWSWVEIQHNIFNLCRLVPLQKTYPIGLTYAAEVFQHTIQEVTAGNHGARNVSNDIICFGSNQAEHNRALDATLHRLHSSGLTVKGQKWELNKDKIEFFGFIFSSAGLTPDQKKVQALCEAPRGSNTSEMHWFLGMAQYIARFIGNFVTITEQLCALDKRTRRCIWTCHRHILKDHNTCILWSQKEHKSSC